MRLYLKLVLIVALSCSAQLGLDRFGWMAQQAWTAVRAHAAMLSDDPAFQREVSEEIYRHNEAAARGECRPYFWEDVNAAAAKARLEEITLALASMDQAGG